MTEEDSAASHQLAKDEGEWTSSRRTGRRAQTTANRHRNAASTASEELRVDTRSKAERESAAERGSHSQGEEQRDTGHGVGSTGSEHSDQLEEPVIPVTVLASMEAETKTGSGRSNGLVPAEHVSGKEEEETEDDIALLEYLSGAETSRKGEDGDDPTPVMSLSPRSFDESLGTPGSPGGLLSVDEHGGFGQSPIRYTTEAPRQASTQVVQSPPRLAARKSLSGHFRLIREFGPEELSETDSRKLSIMLHSGMDLQAVNSDGLTPLHVACKAGNEQAAALLIYYGAKLDARAIRDDATPLILACQTESEGIAKLLVESNASLSAHDSSGNTALHVAVHTGNEGVVIQKNTEGETALHIAAKHGYFGVVRSLLAYGASTKDEDSQGRTPLILSILENHVECVQLLQGVDSNASPAKPAAAPYHSSAYCESAEMLDTPPPLLDDLDESPTNKDNVTPPISPTRVGAVWNRFFENVGQASETRDSNDQKSCELGDIDSVMLLINDNGDSALHLSAWDGSISCVMILLEYGVDPMATNRYGLTALGNMKTRSPMRHKFDDLSEDHPMRRTLVILEEAERQSLQVIESQSTSTEDATEHHLQPPEKGNSRNTAKRPSWASETDDAHTSTTATEGNDADSEDAEDLSSYEESRLMMVETQYEPLTPPPEIEEALRRAKAVQTAPTKIRARYVDTFNTA
uniref:Uncharacterized protein n=1 Tax=Phytophthora ramorum TaxID=164328 RepID=H3HC34_PHYRM